jgi:hypothetical protein
MLNDFGRPLQSACFAHARDVSPIPFDPEFEVFVRIEPLWINRKFGHDR